MPTRPKRSLGQNFLRDEQIVGRIVAALEIEATDAVVEIGPGRGALTRRLVETAHEVIAIEFDRDLIEPLNAQFGDHSNFRLINANALTFDFDTLAPSAKDKKLKLVANLPYNISTPILQKLITSRHIFSRMVLMFQREVVERITAAPGDKERGYLSVLVDLAFETEFLFDVPPAAFYPVPKVWSGVVRLTPKPVSLSDEEAFASLVSVAFTHKRKTILNNLKTAVPNAADLLNDAAIDQMRRAEMLTLEEWIRLFLLSETPGR